MTINYLKLKVDLIQSIDTTHYLFNKSYHMTNVCNIIGNMLKIDLEWDLYIYIVNNKYSTILYDLCDDNLSDRDNMGYLNHQRAVKVDNLSIGIITESI